MTGALEMLPRVRQLVAMLFHAPLEEVTAETSGKTLPRWDSMGHLTLILELEQEFLVQLAPEQVDRMTSVGKIVEVLAEIGLRPD